MNKKKIKKSFDYLNTVLLIISILAFVGCTISTNQLIKATHDRDIEIVKALLSEGSSIDIEDKSGKTPLWIAVDKGYTEIVELLISQGANLEVKVNDLEEFQERPDSEFYTPLWIALYRSSDSNKNKEYLKIAETLIRNGANVNTIGLLDWTPLHVSIMDGNYDFVKFLLKSGADPNLASYDFLRQTPLFLALLFPETKNIEIAELLLQHGADINYVEALTKEPLWFSAINKNDYDLFSFFLEKDVDVNIITETGNTALRKACDYGLYEHVKLLIEKGADVNFEYNDYNPLYIASQNGYNNIVALLLNKDSEPDIISQKIGVTPLYIASQKGHLPVAKTLIDNGANIEFKTSTGSNPLYIATQYGKESIVALLLEKGAVVDYVHPEIGATPLYLASQKGYLPIVKTLIDNGAYIDFKTSTGITPLYIAVLKGQINVVDYLIEMGAIINISSKELNGNTPLHYAAYKGYKEIVVSLLENGADTKALSNSNKTPSESASDGGHTDIMNLINEYSDK